MLVRRRGVKGAIKLYCRAGKQREGAWVPDAVLWVNGTRRTKESKSVNARCQRCVVAARQVYRLGCWCCADERVHRAQAAGDGRPVTSSVGGRASKCDRRRLRSRRLLQQAVDVERGFGARVGEDERCDGFKLGSQWFSIGRAGWIG